MPPLSMLSLAGVFVAIASSGAGLFSVVSSGAGALRPEDALSAGAGAGAPPGAGLAGPDVLAEGGGGDARGADAADAAAVAPASRVGDFRSRTAAEENYPVTRAKWEHSFARSYCEQKGCLAGNEPRYFNTDPELQYCLHLCVNHLLSGPSEHFFFYYAAWTNDSPAPGPTNITYDNDGKRTAWYGLVQPLHVFFLDGTKDRDEEEAKQGTDLVYRDTWVFLQHKLLTQMCEDEICSLRVPTSHVAHCVYLCVNHLKREPAEKFFDYDKAAVAGAFLARYWK